MPIGMASANLRGRGADRSQVGERQDRKIAAWWLYQVLNQVRDIKRQHDEEIGAGNETRTRDPDLGKVVLYQLSYSRNRYCWYDCCSRMLGAGNETRTRDPDLGKVVLYQLSYSRIDSTGVDASANTAFFDWSGKRDSNSRPRPWQGRALPTELFPQQVLLTICICLERETRLELATPTLARSCSTN
jgi:hypothetical protein